MSEPWERVADAERTADEITTFIIFCEDEVSEPYYFRSYQRSGKVKINVAENQLSSFKNILNTLLYCEKEGLLQKDHESYRIKTGTTQHIWSVFDRDAEKEDVTEIDPADNLNFNLSIQTAHQAGLKVAWSNDVFELWILLHFEDIENEVWKHRRYIYDRLTAIFRTLPEQSPGMLAITSHEKFNYKNSFKRRTNFVLYVLPQLTEERRILAVQRAKILENSFPNTYRFHECNPCTKVHHLIESIISCSS